MTEALVDEVVRYAAAGVMAVFVNSRPPVEKWHQANLALPRFVGCDMEIGGRLIGRAMCELAQLVDADGILLLEGPTAKRSNAVRTAWAVREIVGHTAGIPAVIKRVADFNDDDVIDGVSAGVRCPDEDARRETKRLVIHPGTDRAGSALARWLTANDSQLAGTRREIWMVGFDGLRTPDGALLAEYPAGMVATIDQQPYLLGVEAAAHIVAAFEGRSATHPREVLVEPKVLRIARVAEHTRS
jgi:ABC-type sugar transport system substrate-binding protein